MQNKVKKKKFPLFIIFISIYFHLLQDTQHTESFSRKKSDLINTEKQDNRAEKMLFSCFYVFSYV